jgi:hypothetical protein
VRETTIAALAGAPIHESIADARADVVENDCLFQICYHNCLHYRMLLPKKISTDVVVDSSLMLHSLSDQPPATPRAQHASSYGNLRLHTSMACSQFQTPEISSQSSGTSMRSCVVRFAVRARSFPRELLPRLQMTPRHAPPHTMKKFEASNSFSLHLARAVVTSVAALRDTRSALVASNCVELRFNPGLLS